MHFVVKAPNLAHMYIIPNQVNLAIVPSQISPVGGCGGHFKNGRYVTISQKLRGVEPSVSTLHISFSGAYISEKVLQNTTCHCIRHFGGHLYKMAVIYRVIRLSQILRGAEPSNSTLCVGFVGRGFQKKYCRIHHAIVSTIFEAI